MVSRAAASTRRSALPSGGAEVNSRLSVSPVTTAGAATGAGTGACGSWAAGGRPLRPRARRPPAGRRTSRRPRGARVGHAGGNVAGQSFLRDEIGHRITRRGRSSEAVGRGSCAWVARRGRAGAESPHRGITEGSIARTYERRAGFRPREKSRAAGAPYGGVSAERRARRPPRAVGRRQARGRTEGGRRPAGSRWAFTPGAGSAIGVAPPRKASPKCKPDHRHGVPARRRRCRPSPPLVPAPGYPARHRVSGDLLRRADPARAVGTRTCTWSARARPARVRVRAHALRPTVHVVIPVIDQVQRRPQHHRPRARSDRPPRRPLLPPQHSAPPAGPRDLTRRGPATAVG